MTSPLSELRPTFTLHDTPGWPFGWLWYFHLEGGSGQKQYDHPYWSAFYDCPADGHAEKRGTTAAVPYCKEHGYPCGTGDTAEEAIANLQAVLPEWIKSRSLPRP